jgi:hypothetical protein
MDAIWNDCPDAAAIPERKAVQSQPAIQIHDPVADVVSELDVGVVLADGLSAVAAETAPVCAESAPVNPMTATPLRSAVAFGLFTVTVMPAWALALNAQ